MRAKSVFGPRSLQCVQVTKKSRQIIDPLTKVAGRCGECRACWRLWVSCMRALGKPLPKARRDGSIASFMFTARRESTAHNDAARHFERATATDVANA